MANAVTYLRKMGIQADLYDAWAYRHIDDRKIVKEVESRVGDASLVFEVSSANSEQTMNWAKHFKQMLGCTVILTGPHMAAFGDACAKLPWVDFVVVGELEEALVAIAKGTSTSSVVRGGPLKDIDFWPYRDNGCIANYIDPSMCHTPIQLQINGSRGCPFHCTYCAWPQTSYGKYRGRSAENIIGEIQHCAFQWPIRSIFFDDETWGIGSDRTKELCAGLKRIGIPWSIMTRTDILTRDETRMAVNSGCVGIRLGVETTHQRLLDAVNKNLNAEESLVYVRWMLGEFHNLQVRLLTMDQLLGETEAEQIEDKEEWRELQKSGSENNNQVDIQTAHCTVLPGTELWRSSHEQRQFSDLQPTKVQ
jgi:anaerobic magnesium-protoporphyrin IX monomethyl ester cyclase